MKRQQVVFAMVILAFLAVSMPAFAHHGRSGYNMDKMITAHATVTSFEFENPHVQIHFDAPDDQGVIQHWTIEANNPYSLFRVGWTKDTFKPGDKDTFTFHPAKNADGVGLFESGVLPDGKKITVMGIE